MQLITATAPCERLGTVDDLVGFLAGWRRIVGAPHGFQFQAATNVRRRGRKGGRHDVPYWSVGAIEEAPDRGAYNVPPGPFYDDDHRVFGESVGQLAAEWLGNDQLATNTTVGHQYQVVIEDRRAVITGFEALGNDLVVQVTTTPEITALRCCARRRGFASDVETIVADIEAGKADVTFAGPVQQLSVWIVTPDGESLDEYYEDPLRTSWGPSIYNQPRGRHDQPYGDLEQALASGESETVEFKAWIAARERDGKSPEFLRTVAAFANTRGGDLYIGVGDDAELIGTTGKARADYRTDPEAARIQYVKDLRRLLHEGLRPNPAPTFDWIDMAGLFVLRVRVPPAGGSPCIPIETNDVFVRRGATTRKARSEELRTLFAADSGA